MPATTAPTGLTVLGREPAVYLGLITALLSVLIATHILTWTTEQSAVVIAFVAAAAGVWQAWAVRDTRLSVAVTLAKAGIALAVGFGLSVSADTLGVVMTFVTLALSYFLRTQTSPVVDTYPTPAPAVSATS